MRLRHCEEMNGIAWSFTGTMNVMAWDMLGYGLDGEGQLGRLNLLHQCEW